MKTIIAIHYKNGIFSDRWIEYCKTNNISFKIVDCYANNIIKDLEGCRALLWHWQHYVPKDVLVAKQIIFAVETMGVKVFPNIQTCWHFDDKIAQKYLLEAVNAPLVPTFVFYDVAEALRWIETAQFPKVFKLRRGAGSVNVSLIKNRYQAKRFAKKAFKSGFKVTRKPFYDANKQIRNMILRDGFFPTLRKIPNAIQRLNRVNKVLGRESGYFYIQEFIPDNNYDTRITVIGQRAFGFTRNVRPNDFRASGSGSIDYSLKRIEPRCIEIAFETTKSIGAQSLCFDFLRCSDGTPRITEISYAFAAWAVYDCPGFWDQNLVWHEGHIHPEDAILTDLIGLQNDAKGVLD